ncbi:MAG TPA: hypothetical protein VFB76_11835 [Candidatus Angelobacter sp.]|nr:hypothetical protein [Candidatus Angelobacter sp.]
MTGLLACGTTNAQTRPAEQQTVANQSPTASAQISGSQKSAKHGARKIYVSPSYLSGRSARRPRPVVTDPPSPYKIAPSPPRISYSEGKLTVVANNSALSDVLDAIQHATGAKIEGVTPTNADRVFGQFGPASAREVCGTLLTGSAYDFIIMEAPENPGSVQRIILTSRSIEATGSPESQVAAAPSGQPSADDGDSQDTADANDTMDANANGQPATEQASQFQEEPQGVPATQAEQQSGQGQSATPATHPQHWGVHYSPAQQNSPAQQTPQPAPAEPQ